jgi:hypothetical protein
LVSTKVLSLMQFVPTRSNYSAHAKAFVKKRHSLALGAFVCLFFSDEDLNLSGEEPADGGLASGSKNLGLLQ